VITLHWLPRLWAVIDGTRHWLNSAATSESEVSRNRTELSSAPPQKKNVWDRSGASVINFYRNVPLQSLRSGRGSRSHSVFLLCRTHYRASRSNCSVQQLSDRAIQLSVRGPRTTHSSCPPPKFTVWTLHKRTRRLKVIFVFEASEPGHVVLEMYAVLFYNRNMRTTRARPDYGRQRTSCRRVIRLFVSEASDVKVLSFSVSETWRCVPVRQARTNIRACSSCPCAPTNTYFVNTLITNSDWTVVANSRWQKRSVHQYTLFSLLGRQQHMLLRLFSTAQSYSQFQKVCLHACILSHSFSF